MISDSWKECVIFILIGLLFLVGVIYSCYFLSKKSCFTRYSDYSPEYSMFAGCRIEINGKMTPIEAVRTTEL